MRQIVLMTVVFTVLLTAACQRKEKMPKPTVSMSPVAERLVGDVG
jgi:hypothetical protein